MSAVLKRQAVTVIKSRARVLHSIECQMCPRDSLDMTRAGVLTWKSAHGDETHPNMTDIRTLLEWAFGVLDVAALKDLRRMLDEEIERAR